MSRVVPKIPESIPQARRCSICRDLRRLPYVDASLAKGLSAVFIADTLTNTMQLKTSPETVNNHKKHYVAPPPEEARKPEDLAILVRDRTVAAIKEGRLEPSVAHGLQAQALLDKRAEKATDRDVAMALSRLLAGAGSGFAPPPRLIVSSVDDDMVIEGEAFEVDR